METTTDVNGIRRTYCSKTGTLQRKIEEGLSVLDGLLTKGDYLDEAMKSTKNPETLAQMRRERDKVSQDKYSIVDEMRRSSSQARNCILISR